MISQNHKSVLCACISLLCCALATAVASATLTNNSQIVRVQPFMFLFFWQLYSGGELLGGLDIMKEMAKEGELAAAIRPQA